MNDHVLVCPAEPRLLERLRHRAIVIRIEDLEPMPALAALVRGTNHLHAIRLTWPGAVSALPADREWPSEPVVVYAQTLGPMRQLVAVLPLLRRAGFSVLLNSDVEENYIGAALLASLRVHSGIFIGERPIQWDRMRTLMYQALYSRTSHAPVEPFDYVVARYDPASYLDPRGAYFDDPRRFLHLDVEGRIALTSDDLGRGVFATEDLTQLDNAPGLPAYRQRMRAWHQVFLEREACAYCPGWRVCLGAFRAGLGVEPGCQSLVCDLLDAADWHRRLRSPSGGASWQ